MNTFSTPLEGVIGGVCQSFEDVAQAIIPYTVAAAVAFATVTAGPSAKGLHASAEPVARHTPHKPKKPKHTHSSNYISRRKQGIFAREGNADAADNNGGGYTHLATHYPVYEMDE